MARKLKGGHKAQPAMLWWDFYMGLANDHSLSKPVYIHNVLTNSEAVIHTFQETALHFNA